MYWLGLFILSIAVGHRYEQIDGWMVLAEKWDGKLPTTMVPGQTVPFINVK